jgi:hypothetical protein
MQPGVGETAQRQARAGKQYCRTARRLDQMLWLEHFDMTRSPDSRHRDDADRNIRVMVTIMSFAFAAGFWGVVWFVATKFL